MTLRENYENLLDRALNATGDNDTDAIIASIAATDEMLAHFRSSDPYGWLAFIASQATAEDMLLLEARADNGKETNASMNGWRVDTTFLDTQQALYLAAAAVGHSRVPATQLEQRHVYIKIIAAELWKSFNDETDQDAWTERAQRLLARVNAWLERYDDSENGPSILGGNVRGEK